MNSRDFNFLVDTYSNNRYNTEALSGYATVAQSVEQLIRNQQVAGSSPASSSKKDRSLTCPFLYLFQNQRKCSMNRLIANIFTVA